MKGGRLGAVHGTRIFVRCSGKIEPLLETEPGRKLKTTRTELGDNGTGRAEIRVGIRAPQLVRGVAGIRTDFIRNVLNVINYVLLEVGMIEDVESLGAESKLATLSDPKFAGNT